MTVCDAKGIELCESWCEGHRTLEPIYKVGMTVRVTEKLHGLGHIPGGTTTGKIIVCDKGRIEVEDAKVRWLISTTAKSKYNIQILGPMATETCYFKKRTCCDASENEWHKVECETSYTRNGSKISKPFHTYTKSDFIPRFDPDCPECKGTGTWTNPANAVTTPCSMGCGG